MSALRPRNAALVAIAAIAAVVLALAAAGRLPGSRDARPDPGRRLLWFAPDGFRADPQVFDVFRWAREGRLPALRRMMETGTYGYCRPTFPGHTPTNFATLFTGAYPEVHGVNDGPMRVEGRPLESASVGGFSSAAKLVEPVWVTLERELRTDPILLSIPGSTPPELERGETIRGRWGNWGPDFHPVVFQDAAGLPPERLRGQGSRLFFFGPELTRHVEKRPAAGGAGAGSSFSPPLEARLEAWGATLLATIRDETDDRVVSYDRISFSLEGGRGEVAALGAGAWSDWIPVRLSWSPPGSGAAVPVDSSLRVKVVRLEADGRFRALVLFDQLNRHVVDPPELAVELSRAVGPMVDFPDSFPRSSSTCPRTARPSSRWRGCRSNGTAGRRRSCSRPTGPGSTSPTRTPRTSSSPAGGGSGGSIPRAPGTGASPTPSATPSGRRSIAYTRAWTRSWARSSTGPTRIRWWCSPRTTGWCLSTGTSGSTTSSHARGGSGSSGTRRPGPSVSTGMPRRWSISNCVTYIHPGGLGGNWTRASGAEYQSLRRQVGEAILSLKDPSGVAPAEKVVEWERAGAELRLYAPRAGDLVVANRPGFGWTEEITPDLELFAEPLEAGYKQAVLSEEVPGMWTPFLIAGPGVRRGHFLGDDPIEMADQHPTVLGLLGVAPPAFVQGRVVTEAFDNLP